MFSYNNIIEKKEPTNKSIIDNALEGIEVVVTPEVHHLGNKLECMVVNNFLSTEECRALIESCEEVGYTFWRSASAEPKDCSSSENDATACAVRQVDTIEANFPTLSERLYKRVLDCINLGPKTFSEAMENASEVFESDLEGKWLPCGLSTNLLLGRYGRGGHFMPHIDGSTIVDLNTRSMFTLLIYLNDCPSGGQTHIFEGEQSEVLFLDPTTNKYRGNSEKIVGTVEPKQGSAAFFYYDLLHEGSPVKEGLKYICRADVLYRRTPPILTSELDQKAFEVYQEARIAESSGKAEEACRLFQQIRKLSPGVAKLYQLE